MRLRVFILVLLLALPLSGCWDLQEVDRRAFATTVGIDLGPRGKVLLTIQVPLAERPETGTSGEVGSKFVILSAEGDSVNDAFNVLQTKTFRELVIEQNKSIIVGEETARAGLNPLLDFLLRSPKAPPQALVYVARGRTAREILQLKPAQATLPGFQFILSDQSTVKHDRTFFISLWRFEQKLVHETKDAYASLIDLDQEQKTFITAGLAVFDDDRLAGELTPGETQLFGLVGNEMRAGGMTFTLPAGERVTLINIGVKTHIKVRMAGGTPHFEVRTKISGALSELSGAKATNLTVAYYQQLEKAIARILRPRLETVIRKLQGFNSDIINFGEELRVQHQSVWQKLDWKKVFPRAPFKVTVQVKIQRDGVLGYALGK